MDWIEICVTVPVGKCELAAGIANMIVPYGIYIEDYSDLEQGAREIAHIDLIDEGLVNRDRTRAVIHIYLSPDKDAGEAADFLRRRLFEADIENDIQTGSVREQDWAENWKRYFKPFKVGQRLLICPTWEQVPDTEGRLMLNIDPGMAFGTGEHDSTRLVLETLERYIGGGEIVLDIGCGSGILSIAALRLGARSALGVDIDRQAVKTAVENGRVNGLGPPAYRMVYGNLADGVDGVYAVVTANIVADAIIELSRDIRPLIKPDGVFLTSGIIDTREREVKDALCENGFKVVERRERGGWVVLVAKPE